MTLVAAMVACEDSIEDRDLLRAGESHKVLPHKHARPGAGSSSAPSFRP